MPVSNHDMIIATNKTGHIARADPASDRCFYPGSTQIYPADNYIGTVHLGTGKTTKTLIDGANVWTSAGLIDAAPSLDPHPGTGGGVTSHTYLKEASAYTYSKDVKFEKNGVVRTDDRTQQNHKNCYGKVDDSQVKGQVDAASDFLKKKCSIDTLKGQCSHGRELGAPPNGKTDEAFFLDVIAEDEVTLTVTRKDLIANAPSGCKDHTYWGAQRAGQGPDERLDFVGDTFVVKGGVMADPYTGKYSELKKPAEAPKSRAEEKQEKEKEKFLKQQEKKQGDKELTQTSASPPGKANFQPIDDPKNKSDKTYNKKMDEAVNQRAALTAIRDIEKAIAFWLIEREPPVVNVTALACAGAKHVKLQVFPKDGFKFDLFTEALNAKFKLIKNVSSTVEYITRKFNQKYWFKFLEGPNFVLDVQYVELTQDKNGYSKTQVRKSWSLIFSFSPLFEVGCRFTESAFYVLSAIASPAVAKAVQWLLEKAGIKANFFVEVKLTLDPKLSVTWDQYDDKHFDGPQVDLTGTFAFGFEVQVGSWGSAEVKGVAELKLSLGKWRAANPPALAESDLEGYIQLGVEGFAKVSKWGFEKELGKIDWKPAALRYPTDPSISDADKWSKPSTLKKKIATIPLTLK